MDRAGVELMGLMPRHYRAASEGGRSSDEQALAHARQHPSRFIAFVGGQRDDLGPRSQVWHDKSRADQLLREFDRKLASGGFKGIGEFILVHHAYDVGAGEKGGEVRLPVSSDFMRRVSALAAKHAVPLLFHAEAEPQPAKEAEALIAASPKTLFIWAHNCGRASADEIARRLQRFPNLMCDLGHMFNGPRTQGGYGKGWPRKTQWVHLVQDDQGRVVPEMKRLFDAFPDRFMIGTDTAHTHMFQYYEYRIAIFRVMLAQLEPQTARMIGAENARRVFGNAGKRQ
jgi:predicted TIM-barrel fold metal-dependent hydrolase